MTEWFQPLGTPINCAFWHTHITYTLSLCDSSLLYGGEKRVKKKNKSRRRHHWNYSKLTLSLRMVLHSGAKKNGMQMFASIGHRHHCTHKASLIKAHQRDHLLPRSLYLHWYALALFASRAAFIFPFHLTLLDVSLISKFLSVVVVGKSLRFLIQLIIENRGHVFLTLILL